MAADFQEIEAIDDDDRRTCTQCGNLTGRGLCLAASNKLVVTDGFNYRYLIHSW